jgi:hypothetical protein
MMLPLRDRARLLSERVFVGGPLEEFEIVGRLQLITLLRHGVYPHSRVVDIGCGCLRGGYWLIHFLNPDCYCGIEPNAEMLRAGQEALLEPGLLEAKRARFDSNDRFDTGVFGEKFDFFLARSVWTHASKKQIGLMLDAFDRDAAPDGQLLTSYLPALWPLRPDYQGDEWVGRSHHGGEQGLVYHRFSWIRDECERRSLHVEQLEPDQRNSQVWLRVARGRQSRLAAVGTTSL